MMHSKWLSLGTGLGLLLFLATFALLASKRAAPIVTAPVAAPMVSSTVGTTAGTILSTGHGISAPQSVSAPVNLMASSTVPEAHVISATQAIIHSGWCIFTDLEAGYSIQYPGNFVVHSSKSKGETYSTTEITFLALGVEGVMAP